MDISVIIPVKNRAALLRLTLENILNQTLSPYEVIVVDDASTDDIASVQQDYHDRVIFLKSKGTGPGAARNTGLNIAKGEAIQFFDSDDLMTENKLEVQANLLKSTASDVVYGPWVRASFQDGEWQQLDVVMQYDPIPEGLFADFVLQGWCNITQSVLFRRSLIDRVGQWREDIMTHEDYEYWFRIAKLEPKMVHENKTCVIYRQHQNQITDQHTTDESKWLDGLKAFNLINSEINFKLNGDTMPMFKGRLAASKKGYISKFGGGNLQKVGIKEGIYITYFKIKSKITRVKGTSWQKMHGISLSKEVFKSYLNLLAK